MHLYSKSNTNSCVFGSAGLIEHEKYTCSSQRRHSLEVMVKVIDGGKRKGVCFVSLLSVVDNWYIVVQCLVNA